MTPAAALEFETIVPILPVADLPTALAFYVDVLGFELAWRWGEPAWLAAVCRDAIEINLNAQRTGAPVALYLRMRGVDAYYARLTAAGARILVPIGTREYGLRDFRAADPFGNELSFGEAVHAH